VEDVNTNVNADARAGKLMFVSHCILNQNAKVRGIAMFPAAVKPVVDLLLANDVGIYQMPCPEMLYLGAMRWGHVRDQYDSPMFRRQLQALVEQLVDQAEDYFRNGYRVLGFVMVDGSPVCGLTKTPQPTLPGQMWGGMVRYTPSQQFVAGQGVFCRLLQAEAGRRGLSELAFVSIPEVPDAGSLQEALDAIRRVL
jgi:predicted secreted protein